VATSYPAPCETPSSLPTQAARTRLRRVAMALIKPGSRYSDRRTAGVGVLAQLLPKLLPQLVERAQIGAGVGLAAGAGTDRRRHRSCGDVEYRRLYGRQHPLRLLFLRHETKIAGQKAKRNSETGACTPFGVLFIFKLGSGAVSPRPCARRDARICRPCT